MRRLIPLLAGLALVACKGDNDKDGFTSDVDCNDNNPEINPDATELCNDLDDDCDGSVDEDAGDSWFLDADGDGYGDNDETMLSCEKPTGYVSLGDDCDDADDRFYPGATEDDCTDPSDYNCDGSTGYDDLDEDGFAACEDCDDSRGDVYPGAVEICDDVDNDCDSLVDALDPDVEGATEYFLDYDNDGYGGSTVSEYACEQPEGYVVNADDCDDLRAESYPGAEELCDGYDNDCDEDVDEDSGDFETFWADGDGDGYGDVDSPLEACAQPDEYATNADDCDDTNVAVNPAADEICDDGVDNDCDGLADDDDSDTLYGSDDLWYGDGDGDGFGSPDTATLACAGPDDYVDNNDDCDDEDGAVNPDAIEVCDGIDNDCNEGSDEASAEDASTWYLDDDSDGYGQTDETTVSCTEPAGYAELPEDCDDTTDEINPGSDEICNDGLDNDCDETFDACTLELADADAAWLGESSLDDAGIAVGAAGDIDGDGFGDYFIGARDNDGAGTDAGSGYLLFGPVSAGSAELGSVGVELQGSDGGDKFGRAFHGGTDVDGDDVPDIVTSSPSDEAGATASGTAYVFSGADLPSTGTVSADDAMASWLGESSYDYLGVEVVAHDVSGDGVADIIMAATGNDEGASNAGALYVVNGPIAAGSTDFGSTSPDAKILGENTSDGMGQVVDAGVDFDDDGMEDMIIGVGKDATVGVNGGAIYILAGPISGTVSLADADAKLISDSEGAQLGGSIAFLGDQDGDGYGDFVAGAPLEATSGADAGAIYTVYGVSGTSSLDGSSIGDVATGVILGDTTGNQFGEALAGDGDFDGDGTHDLLVGATGGGIVNEGAAYLVYGPVSGSAMASDSDGVFYGEENGDAAGGVVGYAGDVSGGGYDALMISARNSDRAGTDAGTVYLILELGL